METWICAILRSPSLGDSSPGLGKAMDFRKSFRKLMLSPTDVFPYFLIRVTMLMLCCYPLLLCIYVYIYMYVLQTCWFFCLAQLGAKMRSIFSCFCITLDLVSILYWYSLRQQSIAIASLRLPLLGNIWTLIALCAGVRQKRIKGLRLKA